MIQEVEVEFTQNIRPHIPHVAVLSVQLEVCELDQIGQCSGKIVSPKELKEKGVETNFILQVSGWDKMDCINKLKHRLDEFKKGDIKRGELYGQ